MMIHKKRVKNGKIQEGKMRRGDGEKEDTVEGEDEVRRTSRE